MRREDTGRNLFAFVLLKNIGLDIVGYIANSIRKNRVLHRDRVAESASFRVSKPYR
jgi:hypothetical protein